MSTTPETTPHAPRTSNPGSSPSCGVERADSGPADSAHGQDPARLPLTVLAGVGPARAERLACLGLHSVRDLLLLVPRALERVGSRVPAAEVADFVGEKVSVVGRLRAPRVFRRGRRSTVRFDLEDASGKVAAFLFNQPWQLKRLRSLAADASEVELYGPVVSTRGGVALASPRFVDERRPLPSAGSLLPIYGLTEGIGQVFLRRLMASAADSFAAGLRDRLRPEDRAPLGLPSLAEAVGALQRPESEEHFQRAHRRLGFEQVLALQAEFASTRRALRGARARAVQLSGATQDRLRAALPHRPTEAQLEAMQEVAADLRRGYPMRRLLQGDVGSGKTLVAQFAMSLVAESGGQVALLAPTEVLAQQHAEGLAPWFAARGLGTELLLGSHPAPRRRASGERLASGEARVAIGTHALLARGLRFAALDLVVIDEQQRFGVLQKQRLLTKGAELHGAHGLLLSATPIPRTLALSMHGDLEVTRMLGRPPGRGSVETHLVPAGKRTAMLGFLGERLAEGERVFWVCPRIEGEDDAPRGVAQRTFEELRAGPLGRHGVELVHGRLGAEARLEGLERFRRGVARLLVGTTLVEVGLDVPEATVMVVEGAERLGLAQLHQLRGRVGRGPKHSYCLLLADEAAQERLAILRETDDGFRIAEEDLRQRGMGELDGLRQAGHAVVGLPDPLLDGELVHAARELLGRRPELVERYGRRRPGGAALLV